MKRVVIADGIRLEYVLIQTNKSNVLFKALPKGETRVYAPERMRLRSVDELVRARIPELIRMHQELDKKVGMHQEEHSVSAGSRICVEGTFRTMRLSRSTKRMFRITDDEIYLALPDPESDDAVRQLLREKLSSLALERIRSALEMYAPRLGVVFGRVTIREQKTRWGSCSSKQNLNFNWKLIMAPPQALEYVVIHELCHLIEFNHSPRFWRLVESHMPEYAVWKKWLKDHGNELGI